MQSMITFILNQEHSRTQVQSTAFVTMLNTTENNLQLYDYIDYSLINHPLV